MIEVAIAQGLFKLSIALIGFVGARYALVWMDNRAECTNFGEWLYKASDEAKATYYAGRLIAVALVIGLALS